MVLVNKSYERLLEEVEELRLQLEEANETIDAIRSGQVDALVVRDHNGHQLYTLKTADQTYRVFIEKMTEGAVTLNQEGVIVYCNSKFASMVGKGLSEVLGKSFSTFLAKESQTYYETLFLHCWNKDCKGEVCLLGDSVVLPVQLSLTTLELDEGVALSIILTDLTIQKESQEQLSNYNKQLETINLALEESNHELQQFASVASHDLQEPLRKIQIFSSRIMADHGRELNEESGRYLTKVIESAKRMKMLIIDILNYSRLSINHEYFEKVKLDTVVMDVLEDLDLVILERKATIEVEPMPGVEVNQGQIRQLFQNIINNALKFIRQEQLPRISISASRVREKSFESSTDPDGPYCVISIRDNGIGFDEQYSESIFDLFARLHSREKYEGTGIGLAIAKKIVEKHSGLITVNSAIGNGTEFKILLPVEQPR